VELREIVRGESRHGGSMVARQADWLPLRKLVIPVLRETEVEIVDSGGRSL